MRYTLFLDHKKHALKKTDINAKILKEYKGHNLANALVQEAQKRFKDIFKFELVEVPKVAVDAATKGDPSLSLLSLCPLHNSD